MTIVDTTKFAIGVGLLLVGAAILWRARGQRGFGQMKQAGALMLVAALIFGAIGLGLLDL